MTGFLVENDLRVVQVFLSAAYKPGPGIYEVTADGFGNLYCTCSFFVSNSNCKHCTFVEDKIKDNNGSYPLELLSKATAEEAEQAKLSGISYRDFIIKYGKIEVF